MPEKNVGQFPDLSRRDFLKITITALVIILGSMFMNRIKWAAASKNAVGYGSGRYGTGLYGVSSARFSIYLPGIGK
jgi:hypothetical protein